MCVGRFKKVYLNSDGQGPRVEWAGQGVACGAARAALRSQWAEQSEEMAAWRQAISKNLREVRIHLCQTSKSSQGVR